MTVFAVAATAVIIAVLALANVISMEGDTMLAKKLALGFGIAVLFPFVVYYGVSTFSAPPNWRDYQMEQPLNLKPLTPGEEQRFTQERRRLDDLRHAHQIRFEKWYFAVSVPLGIAAIIAGAFIGVQAIGTGIMFGGILSLTHGYLTYWDELPDGLQFISVLAAFAVLIVVGWRRFGDSHGLRE